MRGSLASWQTRVGRPTEKDRGARYAFVGQAHLPLPPLLGGAIQANIAEISSRMEGREVLVLSPAHPGLPAEERSGGLTHRRVALPSPPLLDRKGRELDPRRVGEIQEEAYLEGVAKALEEFEGTVVVGNRPQFAGAVRNAAPGARLVLSLANLHLRHREALASYDAIIAWSGFVRDEVVAALGVHELMRGEDGERAEDGPEVHVVRGGIDLARFAPAAEADRRAAKRALGLGEGPVVLFVGRLVEYKGAHLLLDALPAVRARFPEVTLVVVGAAAFGSAEQPPYERALRARGERVGSTRFAGLIPPSDTSVWWRAADVFCGPALWDEPLGLVYEESLASGVPAVGSARGGIPEIVDHGKTGLLLPRSPSGADVVAALITLLEDGGLRERIGRRGREVAEERFDIEDAARTTEKILQG